MNSLVSAKANKSKKFSVDNEIGASMIEGALVMPVLAIFLFGIIQYGMLFSAYISLRNAASFAARQSVLEGMGVSDVQFAAQEAIKPALDPGQLRPVGVDTSFSVGGAPATRVVMVYDYPVFFSLVVPGVGSGGTYPITAVSIMR